MTEQKKIDKLAEWMAEDMPHTPLWNPFGNILDAWALVEKVSELARNLPAVTCRASFAERLIRLALHSKLRDIFAELVDKAEYEAATAISEAILEAIGDGEMTVRDIIKKFLENNGYDGLYSEGQGLTMDDTCACELADLCPCGEDFSDCQPGYKVPCDGPSDMCDGKCNFHIVAEKPDDK